MIFKIAIGVAIALALGYLMMLGGADVSGSEARRLVESGALLVDVRTVEEFAIGHIPGAINIPVQNLDRRMAELGSKDKPIVLYCRSGTRSGRAARMLKSAGYGAVHNLGGMNRW